jgi:hypothetical protein
VRGREILRTSPFGPSRKLDAISGELCKHILAVGILYAKTHRRVGLQEHPHACMDGWIYLGYTDENGEEAIECLPCRRCREGGSIIRTLHRRGGHTTLK